MDILKILMAIYNFIIDTKIYGYRAGFAAFMIIFSLATGSHYFNYLYVTGHMPHANDWFSFLVGHFL